MSSSIEKELQILARDKYQGNVERITDEDIERLGAEEPLAYIIGWVPFLDIKVFLDSKPLIPRPETEWWTELLIARLRERFDSNPFTFLDLCAGSGAIGLAVLKAFPSAHVYFAELIPEHCALIQKNIARNRLDGTRATVIESNLFESIPTDILFDGIATNPPYIPDTRVLEDMVTSFEPSEALFAGNDGLSIIKPIAENVAAHLSPDAEVWMECDIDNAEKASKLLTAGGATRTEVRTDLYGRLRLVVAYF